MGDGFDLDAFFSEKLHGLLQSLVVGGRHRTILANELQPEERRPTPNESAIE